MQTSNWCSPASACLTPIKFTANDKLFPVHLYSEFHPPPTNMQLFLCFCLIKNNYVQGSGFFLETRDLPTTQLDGLIILSAKTHTHTQVAANTKASVKKLVQLGNISAQNFKKAVHNSAIAKQHSAKRTIVGDICMCEYCLGFIHTQMVISKDDNIPPS